MEYAVNRPIMLKEPPVLERAKAVADAGFKAVEFWQPWDIAVPERENIDVFVASIHDTGIQLIGLNSFAGDMPGGECGLVLPPPRIDDSRTNVPVVVEIGRELGCETSSALYSPRRKDIDVMVQDTAAIDSLEFAAKAVAKIGATVLVEPVSGAAGYPLKTIARILAVVEKLEAKHDVENVGSLHDLYHLAANRGNAAAVVAGSGGAAAHCQITDFPGHGKPGTGDLNIAGLLAFMKKTGYDDWVALEYVPTITTAGSLDNLPGLP